MESYPKFQNEVGAPIVRIGCREFECIGDKPPQDHPHIYLNMGDASDIVCPYCSTLFRFDPTLGAREADPAECAYGDVDLVEKQQHSFSPCCAADHRQTPLSRTVGGLSGDRIVKLRRRRLRRTLKRPTVFRLALTAICAELPLPT